MIMVRLALVSLVLVLAGCGAMNKLSSQFVGVDNSEPPTPLAEIAQRINIIEVWSKNVGKGYESLYLKLTPAIYDNHVYIADSNGELSAIDVTSGKAIWRVDTDHPVTGGPGAGAGLILLGTSEGEVLAYSADQGKFLWKSRVSSEVLAAPQADDNIVVVRSIDGKIFGLNGETGSRLWIYDRTVPALTLRGTSAPIIQSGLVITGFDGGKLVALDLRTGKLLWETEIAQASGRSELDRMVDIDSEPIIREGVIYVATFQGNIAAVDLQTGQLQWSRDIPSYAGLGLDPRHVYLTDDESNIWALERFSGSSVWKQESLKSRAATAPASIGNYVVIGDLEGYLHWLDSETGEFVARHQFTKNRIIAPPVAYQDIIYAYSSNGTLGAFTYQ